MPLERHECLSRRVEIGRDAPVIAPRPITLTNPLEKVDGADRRVRQTLNALENE
jgi:hypothetical protein